MTGSQISLDVGVMAIVVALVALGWAAMYWRARRNLNRAVADLRREMDERMNLLLALVKAEQARADEVRQPAKTASTLPPPARVPVPPTEKKEEITPESLFVIAAAVTAYLGKKVRVRSARMLQTPYEIVNPWVQQGRVVVQASHNLAQRSHGS